MARPVLVFAVALAAAGCSLAALDGVSGGERDEPANGDTATDASPSDAAPEALSGDPDAGIAGPANLLVNGGFEEGVAACGPGWSPDRTTLTRSTDARTGSASCLVCLGAGKTIGNVFPTQNALSAAKAGDTYLAEAWVAAAPDTPAARMSIQLLVDGTNLAFGSVTPEPGWQLVQIQGAAGHDGTLNFALRVRHDDGPPACYLVDDVVVIKQ
jgi:hypothetical protein